MRRWGGSLPLLTFGTGWRALYLCCNSYQREGCLMAQADLDATTTECRKNVSYSSFCGRTRQRLESWPSWLRNCPLQSQSCASLATLLPSCTASQLWESNQCMPSLKKGGWSAHSFESLLPKEGPQKEEPWVQPLVAALAPVWVCIRPEPGATGVLGRLGRTC